MPGDEPKPKRSGAVQLSLPQAHPYTPEAYVNDAAKALRNCGNPVVLYDRFIASGVTGTEHAELMLAQAGQTLIRQATAGVLFCGFAAEAYVNRFLAAMLSKADFAAVDRLATMDKYVIAVPCAKPDITFNRGEWPIGDLTRLFSMRNALVHHKPDNPPRGDITPLLAADFLIAVAEAARRLVAANRRQDIRPMLITKDADHLRAWARRCVQAPPPPVGEDTHPPDLMLDAFRRHFGEQLERHAAQHIPPPRNPDLNAVADLIDLDAEATWPDATRRWAGEHAGRLADSTKLLADLAISLEQEDEFRQTFGPRKPLAYHATRLLPHETDAIRTSGLRLLDEQLIRDRIDHALAHGALPDAARHQAETRNVYAIRSENGRAGQICFVIGRTAFDEDAGGCDALLRQWGGEAIRGGPGEVPALGTVGVPSIVVAKLNLTRRHNDPIPGRSSRSSSSARSSASSAGSRRSTTAIRFPDAASTQSGSLATLSTTVILSCRGEATEDQPHVATAARERWQPGAPSGRSATQRWCPTQFMSSWPPRSPSTSWLGAASRAGKLSS